MGFAAGRLFLMLKRYEIAWIGAVVVLAFAVSLVWLEREADRFEHARAKREADYISGMIELETLKVAAASRPDVKMSPQDTDAMDFGDGFWSQHRHALVSGALPGDWIELELPRLEPGRYFLTGFFTRSYDYAVIQIRVNNTLIDRRIDLWSTKIENTGPMKLGMIRISGVRDRIRFDVVERNPENNAKTLKFGVDGIKLKRVQLHSNQQGRGARIHSLMKTPFAITEDDLFVVTD